MATIVYAKNANDAWKQWWDLLNQEASSGIRHTSRDGAVAAEILNAITVVENPRRPIVEHEDRNMSLNYAVGEFLWYMSGTNRVSAITPYGKAWNELTDDGQTTNSAYGYRIFEKYGFDQMEFVEELLSKDPSSRQAVVHIKDASNVPTKDVPCTLTLQFLIRDNKLHCTATMRSNDIWLGMPYDFFAFMNFQVILAMRLGVDVGTYTHQAASLHLYDRNVPKTQELQVYPSTGYRGQKGGNHK